VQRLVAMRELSLFGFFSRKQQHNNNRLAAKVEVYGRRVGVLLLFNKV
jgi:hypothetical protein